LVGSTIGSLLQFAFQTTRTSLTWFRMLIIYFLLKSKDINDNLLTKIQRKPFLTALPQRLLILAGTFLELFIVRISPNDRTLAELKKSKQQQYRSNQSSPYFVNRPSCKQDPATKPRQNVIPVRPEPVFTRQEVFHTRQETVVSRSSNSHSIPKPPPDYSNLNDTEELYARLVDNDEDTGELIDGIVNNDIAELYAQVKPTDSELLYTQLAAEDVDEQDNFNQNQQ